MSQSPPKQDASTKKEEEEEEHKLHISRVPSRFDETIVQRILQEKLQDDTAVTRVELIYPKPEHSNNNNESSRRQSSNQYHQNDKASGRPQLETTEEETAHRGFGFVYLASAELLQRALALETVKGGRKVTSKRKYVMHVRPYVDIKDDNDKNDNSRQVCYLWVQRRCPYGNNCKFLHTGSDGACIETTGDNNENSRKRRRVAKCFMYKTKGKCQRGDDCPFSHEFTVTNKNVDVVVVKRDNAEKDCFTWAKKGTCSKRDRCVYRHDPEVQAAALRKLKQKKKSKPNPPKQQQQQPQTA